MLESLSLLNSLTLSLSLSLFFRQGYGLGEAPLLLACLLACSGYASPKEPRPKAYPPWRASVRLRGPFPGEGVSHSSGCASNPRTPKTPLACLLAQRLERGPRTLAPALSRYADVRKTRLSLSLSRAWGRVSVLGQIAHPMLKIRHGE